MEQVVQMNCWSPLVFQKPIRINLRVTYGEPWALFCTILSSFENIVKLCGVLCSQSGSSWLIGDKDLMLPLQYHLFCWRYWEHNQLSEKNRGSGKQRMWFSWQVQSPNLMSSESGLERLDTSPLFWLVFARPGSAHVLSATNPCLGGSLKPAGLLPPDWFICVEKQQQTPSIKHIFANVP